MTTNQPLLDARIDMLYQDIGEEKNARWEPMLISAKRRSLAMTSTFLTSILINVVLAFLLLQQSHCSASTTDEDLPTPFAALRRNVSKQWDYLHPGTDEQWADLWANHSSYRPGIVALDDDYARKHGLPRAQRFPWDENKGLYVLNAYHNLHCLQRIRQSLEDFRYHRKQSIPWEHVRHCLLSFRDEIHCNADDTPRYTGFQPQASSGLGQSRMCRDWSKLETWARDVQREGCWKEIPGVPELDRYRFCSEENQYKEVSENMWLSDEEKFF